MPNLYGLSMSDSATALPSIRKSADAFSVGARLRTSPFRITVPSNTDLATNDVIRMGTINSNDRVHSLRLSSDAFPTNAAVNIGLYLTGSNHDGAVVDADLFATAVDIATAALNRTDVLMEATAGFAVDRGKRVWEFLGLTADPRVNYDLALVLTGNPAATGSALDILLEYEFVSGS